MSEKPRVCMREKDVSPLAVGQRSATLLQPLETHLQTHMLTCTLMLLLAHTYHKWHMEAAPRGQPCFMLVPVNGQHLAT